MSDHDQESRVVSIGVPMVIEQSSRGDRAFDLFSRLLRDRIIFIGTPIDEIVANIIVGQLLLLFAEDRGKDIFIYINSPGGEVNAGLGILDAMHYVNRNGIIVTTCFGQAASMAAVLLAAGTKGRRCCLPNAEVMIHQPIGGVHGQVTDIEIHGRRILQMREQLNRLLAGFTGQTLEKIRQDTERDNFMTAEQARAYGLIDGILVQAPVS